MILLKFAALMGLAAAWDTDERCPDRRDRRLRGHGSTAAAPVGRRTTPPEEDAASLARRQLEGGNLVFHMKMYWEEGFCWQDEWRERRWCLDCNGHDCNLDDIISTQDCAETSMQEFVWIPQGNADGRGSLKVANKDLCFERYSNQEYRLRPCSGKDRQMYLGFTYEGPFELYPLFYPDRCISQHHDPKPDEEIYGVTCVDARRDYTNRWEVWWAKQAPSDLVDENFPELASEGISCTPGNPCALCEGDCDIDADCGDGLACFQRVSTENPWGRIPGCAGDGRKNVDYCYNPEAPSRDGELLKLITLYEDCTSDNPCDKCYGDCDNEDQCVGNLKCYQRRNYDNEWEGVPGCYSSGWRAWDYCYDPGDTPGPTPDHMPAPYTTMETTAAPTPNISIPMLTHSPTPVPTTSSPIAKVTVKPTTTSPIAAMTPEPTAASPIPEPTTVPVVTPTSSSDELVSLSIDCTTEKKCERCFGDCDSDDHCTGDLECFSRSTSEGNSFAPVPGCTGVGIESWDYCYDPSGGTGPTPTKAPVETPMDSPNDPPTDAPINTPPPTGRTSGSPDTPVSFCLSSETLVTVKRGDSTKGILMKDLKVGDHVQDGADSFSQVYSFGHYNQHAKTPYLQVHIASADPSQQPLELSREHMAFVYDGAAVPASMLSAGDFLSLANGDHAEILHINPIVRRGAYAPFTESGKLIANELLVSSFVAMDPNRSGVNVYGIPVLSYQWLAYVTQTPHRLYCKVFGVDESPDYTENGLSVWVAVPFEAGSWIVRQHEVVQLMILSLTIAALMPMTVLEGFFTCSVPMPCRMATLTVLIFVGAFKIRRSRYALKVKKC
jgi:hypothetical protein